MKNPNYDKYTFQNDIAIIKLAKNITLSRSVQIACLPDPDERLYPEGDNIVSWVLGWGTSLYGVISHTRNLNYAELIIYKNEICDDVLPSLAKNWNIEMCAGL